ncbi:uncharacterized protein EDB91DRAFT_480687 [Suillus paluster]|uniref:uncharacterized protein n=1 Tax=Suillus paluster TaxID=48578 RepID=UPI001B877488|nr:uncharacterized protein EDB91DRAFT_480687 [Suillus paluster]KAG1737511.1 hypothetical protein EDB91DRAFT_480687 [Suillus paluster]
MLSVRNSLAGHDVSGDAASAYVPDPERTRNIRLALESLDTTLAHKYHQESHSPIFCSGVPSLSTPTTPPKVHTVLRHKKKYRPPPLILDVQHSAQQCPRSILDPIPTEPQSRLLKSQRSLPILRTVPVTVPTHAYRSSITFAFPTSSPATTVTPTPTYLTVPSVQPPLSPLTPPPPSPSTTKRKRFSRLCRKFGESPPPELVFGGGPAATEARGGMQKNALAPTMEEDEDLDTASSEGTSEDHHPSSLFMKDADKLHHIPKQYGTAWLLERKGRRVTQRNYEDVMKRLRML